MSWLENEPFVKIPRAGQWCLLFGMSVVLIVLLQRAHLPAVWLLGSTFAGIFLVTGGGSLRVPEVLYWFSQAVIGCLMARVITPKILKTFMGQWPLFLGIVLGVIAASCALGWLLNRLRLFPDATAIWGLLPGAASVMMIMADDFGADGRLVAFMQYLRVVFVALAAALVARFVHASATVSSPSWFSAVHWTAFLETLVFIVVSVILGRKSGIRGGGILVPLALGAMLNVSGVLPLELPSWFLAVNYALLGWNIGLRFSRKILAHATRTLPQTILSVALLMGFCWGLAWVLVKADAIDPLTAYLATSPGGLDAATIIAASCKVDIAFVVSMQAARFGVVLMIGPVLSRWFARWVRTESASPG